MEDFGKNTKVLLGATLGVLLFLGLLLGLSLVLIRRLRQRRMAHSLLTTTTPSKDYKSVASLSTSPLNRRFARSATVSSIDMVSSHSGIASLDGTSFQVISGRRLSQPPPMNDRNGAQLHRLGGTPTIYRTKKIEEIWERSGHGLDSLGSTMGDSNERSHSTARTSNRFVEREVT